MEPIDKYLELARSAPLGMFVLEHPSPVLLKRPAAGHEGVAERQFEFSYRTAIVKLKGDPFPAAWLVATVRKRDGSPFAGRISIGRAPNCDVVIRVPSVSKLHAHLVATPDGSFELVDLGSTTGTRVNGTPLDKNQRRVVRFGDSISLGQLLFEFMDSRGFYGVLTTEFQR